MKARKGDFFGRESELKQLDGLWEKRGSSLVTCRGRRRIGKSTLIEEFARRSGARFVKLEGLRPKPGMTENDQLSFFAAKLAAQTGCENLTIVTHDEEATIESQGHDIRVIPAWKWLMEGVQPS